MVGRARCCVVKNDQLRGGYTGIAWCGGANDANVEIPSIVLALKKLDMGGS